MTSETREEAVAAKSYRVTFDFARMKDEARKRFAYAGTLFIADDTLWVEGKKTGFTADDGLMLARAAVGRVAVSVAAQVVAEVRGEPLNKPTKQVFPIYPENTRVAYDARRRLLAFWTPYARWLLVKPAGSIFRRRRSRAAFVEMLQEVERVLGLTAEPAVMNRMDPFHQLINYICIFILVAIVLFVTGVVLYYTYWHGG